MFTAKSTLNLDTVNFTSVRGKNFQRILRERVEEEWGEGEGARQD